MFNTMEYVSKKECFQKIEVMSKALVTFEIHNETNGAFAQYYYICSYYHIFQWK